MIEPPEEKLILAGKRHRHKLQTDVFTAAHERMLYIYQNFDRVIISWSGGKDSTTVLETARRAARELGKLPIEVFFLDEEVIYPETIDLVYHHLNEPDIKFYWVCIPSIYRNACSEVEPDFIPWDPTKRHLWVREPVPEMMWPAGFDAQGLPVMNNWRVPPSIPKRAMIEMFAKPNPDQKIINLTGLRIEESHVRYMGLVSSGSFIAAAEGGIYHGRPIYDWTARDVWLAFKDNNWAYNRAYDKLWRLGKSVTQARVAPLFHAEAAMSLPYVKKGWPRFWPLVKARVRGAQAVANYGGALHALKRLPGETWQQAANRFLFALGDEADKKMMVHYVQMRALDEHAQHSTSELPDEEPCPVCAMSWKKVAKAVLRGDRQQRMLRNPKSSGLINPIIRINENDEDENG